MRTFVMGDIHGQHQSLLQCLERSNFNREDDHLIQLGDVIDRGADSYECIEELLGIKNLVAIRGNHDEWFRQFLHTGWHPAGWEFGGVDTARSYCRLTGKDRLIRKGSSGWKIPLDPSEVPLPHRQFFDRQVDYFIDGQNNSFVHAGFDRFRPFLQQASPSVYYWERSLWTEALAWLGANLLNPENGQFEIHTSFNDIFLGHTLQSTGNRISP